MRIISGSLKGGTVRAPRGTAVRPTSDKVREALFDILQERIAGASFLDLFAGVGAVGIEALSRGAERVSFVEKKPTPLRFLEENIAALRLSDRASIYRVDVLAFLSRPQGGPYDIVFADPPYGSDILRKALPRVAASDIITPETWVIVEHHHKLDIEEPTDDFRLFRRRRYGETVLSFFSKAK
jgi:16S rRNA (guanine(966)-N(2))-methyltransferase RsmD